MEQSIALRQIDNRERTDIVSGWQDVKQDTATTSIHLKERKPKNVKFIK